VESGILSVGKRHQAGIDLKNLRGGSSSGCSHWQEKVTVSGASGRSLKTHGP